MRNLTVTCMIQTIQSMTKPHDWYRCTPPPIPVIILHTLHPPPNTWTEMFYNSYFISFIYNQWTHFDWKFIVSQLI